MTIEAIFVRYFYLFLDVAEELSTFCLPIRQVIKSNKKQYYIFGYVCRKVTKLHALTARPLSNA